MWLYFLVQSCCTCKRIAFSTTGSNTGIKGQNTQGRRPHDEEAAVIRGTPANTMNQGHQQEGPVQSPEDLGPEHTGTSAP